MIAAVATGVVLALLAAALFGGARRVDTHLRDGPFGAYGVYRPSDQSSSAALLPDGRVLIVSGAFARMGEVIVPRADIWDPENGRTPTGPPTIGRVAPTATLLLDGRVLVVGGYGGPFLYGGNATASAEIWDPATETFRPTGSLAAARVGHTATMLPDGRVLVVGGIGPGGDVRTAELWDPATGQFRPAGRLATDASGHAAVLLPDGLVVVAGGGTLGQAWRPTHENFTSRVYTMDGAEYVTLTRLLDGRVLMVQGTPADATIDVMFSHVLHGGSSEPLLNLNEVRTSHDATLLSDGRVLVTGGTNKAGELLASVEVWDPAAFTFTTARPLERPVAGHTALLLTDGQILIVPRGTGAASTVEPFIYAPGYP